MKAVLSDIADFLTIAAVIVLLLCLKKKTIEARVKDLGDGGIQKLF